MSLYSLRTNLTYRKETDMQLKLNKKKLVNLSDDAKVIPSEETPNIAGGDTIITIDIMCDATGSCGCISDPRDTACNTNTCY